MADANVRHTLELEDGQCQAACSSLVVGMTLEVWDMAPRAERPPGRNLGRLDQVCFHSLGL